MPGKKSGGRGIVYVKSKTVYMLLSIYSADNMCNGAYRKNRLNGSKNVLSKLLFM